jgi:two-component sensor histidine kinase
MIKFLHIILLLLFATICKAQSYTITYYNELQKELHHPINETAQTKTLLRLGGYYQERLQLKEYKTAVDSTIFYARKAEALAKKNGKKDDIARSYVLLAHAEKVKGNFDIAEDYARKAVAIFTENGNKEDLVLAYTAVLFSREEQSSVKESMAVAQKIRQIHKGTGNIEKEVEILRDIAFLHMVNGNVNEASKLLREGLTISGSSTFLAKHELYALMSVIYNQYGNYDDALKYALDSARIIEKYNDNSLNAAESYNFIGLVYNSIKQENMALDYFLKAYNIAKKYTDESFTVMLENNIVGILMKSNRFKESKPYLKDMMDKFNELPNAMQNLVLGRSILTYTKLKNYKEAKIYADKAISLSKKMADDDIDQSYFYPFIIMYLFKTEQYTEAREFVNKYKALNTKMPDARKSTEIHHMLFQLDSVENKYNSALANLKIEQAYKDSMFNEKSNQQIAELQIKYATEKKEKDLQLKEKSNGLLKKQAELQQSKILQANIIRNISFVSIAILLVIMAMVYRRYKINKRMRTEINLKNATLEKLITEKEYLLKEVHHRVKNNLQVVMSLLNTQTHFLKDDTAIAAIKNSQHRIHSMSLIHKKLYQSENVVSINMEIYISELIEYFKEAFDIGQRIRFIAEIDEIELDTTQAVPLGLILNEAITNAIKHAFPVNSDGTITIILKRSLNTIELTISDDGIGMVNLENNTSSLGLKLIRGFSGELNAEPVFANINGLVISLSFDCDKKTADRENSQLTRTEYGIT